MPRHFYIGENVIATSLERSDITYPATVLGQTTTHTQIYAEHYGATWLPSECLVLDVGADHEQYLADEAALKVRLHDEVLDYQRRHGPNGAVEINP